MRRHLRKSLYSFRTPLNSYTGHEYNKRSCTALSLRPATNLAATFFDISVDSTSTKPGSLSARAQREALLPSAGHGKRTPKCVTLIWPKAYAAKAHSASHPKSAKREAPVPNYRFRHASIHQPMSMHNLHNALQTMHSRKLLQAKSLGPI